MISKMFKECERMFWIVRIADDMQSWPVVDAFPLQ
jgi:hypothetical protein